MGAGVLSTRADRVLGSPTCTDGSLSREPGGRPPRSSGAMLLLVDPFLRRTLRHLLHTSGGRPGINATMIGKAFSIFLDFLHEHELTRARACLYILLLLIPGQDG
jgi:hypothetical protein